jgi:hypothetical protein
MGAHGAREAGMMGSMERPEQAVIELIREAEEQLLRPEVRKSVARAAALLADEFIEIGSSGRIYDKPQIIALFQQEGGKGSIPTISDFSTRQLTADVVLVTYRIIESQTMRSSIWKLMDGQWRMVFHQGTRYGVQSYR